MAETWRKLAFETDVVLKTAWTEDTFMYASVASTPVASSPADVLAALSGHAGAGFDFNSQVITAEDLIIADGGSIGSSSEADALKIAADGTLTIKTCIDAGEDTDKFLVLDGAGNVDYRSGAEVLSDIGGASGAHALLDGTVNSDTVAQDVTRGSIIYANATPAWDELVIGAADTFLGSDGTDASYRTAAQVIASLSAEAGAAFDWNGQQMQNMLLQSLADGAAKTALTAVVGMIAYQVDDDAVYICTEAE